MINKVQMNLSSDLIGVVISFLSNNNDSIFLLSTCKYFHSLTKKIGYIRKIHINYLITYTNYLYINKHNLYFTEFTGSVDPHLYLQKWSKIIKFNNCQFQSIIDPENVVETEELTIRLSTEVKINWNKFKNLKMIYLDLYKINFEDCDKLDKLEKVFLNIKSHPIVKYKTPDITFIQDLPNLHTFLTTVDIHEPLHLKTNKIKLFMASHKGIYYNNNKKYIGPKRTEANINAFVN